MAAAKPVTSIDISDIQRQMAQIRHEMHQEVQGAVRTAQYLTDWQTVVKSHPWLSLSIASVAGYLLVPKRHSRTDTIVAMGTPTPVMAPATVHTHFEPTPRKSHWTILGTALSLAAPIALRAAQNYALRHLEEWLSQHPLQPGPSWSASAPKHEPDQSKYTGPAGRLREYG